MPPLSGPGRGPAYYTLGERVAPINCMGASQRSSGFARQTVLRTAVGVALVSPSAICALGAGLRAQAPTPWRGFGNLAVEPGRSRKTARDSGARRISCAGFYLPGGSPPFSEKCPLVETGSRAAQNCVLLDAVIRTAGIWVNHLPRARPATGS